MTADLALAADAGFIGRSADPGGFIIHACERARMWLREALEHGDIDQIVEVRSQAEAVRVYTVQKRLGKDAQLSATGIVRRAERGIGVAIRRGQEAGEIRKKGDDTRTDLTDRHVDNALVSPTDYAKGYELSGGGSQPGIYDLTDGVSDEDFEAALTEARDEENLSRANVARRIRARKPPHQGERVPDSADRSPQAAVQRRKLIGQYAADGYSSRQIAAMTGISVQSVKVIAQETNLKIAADELIGSTRKHDSARIVRETADALEGLVMAAGLVSLDDLDPAEARDWAASIAVSARALGRLARQIRETFQ